jgi:hypothetical protein
MFAEISRPFARSSSIFAIAWLNFVQLSLPGSLEVVDLAVDIARCA